jgi:uncharacterized protein
VDGRFHACEKLNDSFPAGDVSRGIDFKRIADILNQFEHIIEEKCSGCDIRHLCFRCFVPFAKNGCFKLEKSYCGDMKKSTKESLERHVKFETQGVN